MSEENISQEFRLKIIDEIWHYLIEEIDQNELMSKKHKKVCIESFELYWALILISTISRCVSISAFASLVGIPIGIMSSAIGLKICVINVQIKKYKSIINKRKRNMIK